MLDIELIYLGNKERTGWNILLPSEHFSEPKQVSYKKKMKNYVHLRFLLV